MPHTMKEYNGIDSYKNDRSCVVTIGTFDGVHLGHKAILDRLVTTAKQNKLDSVLLTFFPHPRMVLQQDFQIRLINTINERKELLEKTGLDHLVVHPFTMEFSRLNASEFVRDFLVNKLHAKKIIIGYDHRFGRNRNATIEDLKEYGVTYGFEVIEIGVQQMNEVAVSSTKIRKAVKDGNIERANSFLGYSFMLSGIIIEGRGIGKTLDFPTANLQVDEDYKLIPAMGVYIVRSLIDGKIVYGLTNIGLNPTVGGSKRTIETYFLDFNNNIYNQPIRLEFLKRIREEKQFSSVEDLRKAIKKDELFARVFLEQHE
jgi:riboflavin kinase/FMN adenylyltransferase